MSHLNHDDTTLLDHSETAHRNYHKSLKILQQKQYESILYVNTMIKYKQKFVPLNISKY